MKLNLYIGPTISQARLERRFGYPTDDRRPCEEVADYRSTQPDTRERYVRVPFTGRYRRVR